MVLTSDICLSSAERSGELWSSARVTSRAISVRSLVTASCSVAARAVVSQAGVLDLRLAADLTPSAEPTRALLGDPVAANMFLLGAAWQRGQIPLQRASIERAIELNGVAVALNREAFAWGRRAAHDLAAVERCAQERTPAQVVSIVPLLARSVDDIVRHRSEHLVAHTGPALAGFHHLFFSLPDAPGRTRKHIATPERKSSCKRLNMFLRWMVRRDDNGVDFGLWRRISPAQLLMPLDVHVDRVARRLGLLERRQTDWPAVLELTDHLRDFDPLDPVKYDFALFGLGLEGG